MPTRDDRRIGRWVGLLLMAAVGVAVFMSGRGTSDSKEPAGSSIASNRLDERRYLDRRRELHRAALDQRWDGVIAGAPELLAWRDDDADVWRWLGMAHQHRGDFERSAEAWEQAAALPVLRAQSLVRLAAVRQLLGQTDEALDVLDEAYELGYRDVSTLREIQGLMSLSGDPRFARLIASMEGRDGAP